MDPKSTPSARLDPLPLGHATDLAEEFEALAGTLGFVPNSVLTTQRKPKLVKAFSHLGGDLGSRPKSRGSVRQQRGRAAG